MLDCIAVRSDAGWLAAASYQPTALERSVTFLRASLCCSSACLDDARAASASCLALVASCRPKKPIAMPTRNRTPKATTQMTLTRAAPRWERFMDIDPLGFRPSGSEALACMWDC